MDEQTLAIIAEHEGMEPTDEYRSEVEDRYLGTAEDAASWAYDYCDGAGMTQGIDPLLKWHIDWAGVAHDMQLSGDITVVPVPGGVVVLHN